MIQNMKNISLGIITYDYNHLKTEQLLHILIRKGFERITVFALPFVKREPRKVIFEHRPNQSTGIHPYELAFKHKLNYIKYDGLSPLKDCDYYLIAGAGILPENIIPKEKIINAHPGIIPSARGLDSFKWSILNDIQIGITLHFIDGKVDEGNVIKIFKTPIYENDSLNSLARRHYESEIDILANFLDFINEKNSVHFPKFEAKKRMPTEKEELMIKNFDHYKKTMLGLC